MKTIFRSDFFVFLTLFILAFGPAAHAQELSAEQTAQQHPATQDADFPDRYAIAKELHVIWQTETQVKEGILEEADAIQDPTERKRFLDFMSRDLDIKKIEEIASVAMAENFTLHEMQAMKIYFTSPLGRSAEAKRRIIERKMRPDIKAVVDASLYKYQAEMQQRVQNDPRVKKMYPNGLPAIPQTPQKTQ
ncbi:MAG: hypothetical protein GC136_06375 [Alphaproteobacteria bacterium]|nr:hypothetical protein [Alphaproteobacteria bacterium]